VCDEALEQDSANIPSEGAAPNPALRKQSEEALDLFEPTDTGGREMRVITGSPRKPPFHLRVCYLSIARYK